MRRVALNSLVNKFQNNIFSVKLVNVNSLLSDKLN